MTTRHLCAIIDLAFAGVAHLVERDLAKVEVASSSLVARSKKERHPHGCLSFLEQHFCYAKVVACGRVIEREWGNPSKVPPSHSPFLAVGGSADNKTCGQPKRRPLQRSGLLFWKCAAGRFEPAVRQFRCRRKLPPVWTPSCTMKNAWGSSSCITCCRVPISYLDRHTHSTCTSSPV